MQLICGEKERAQMKGSKVLRVALDVALTVMIVFEMLIQFTGEFLHEVVGFAFFATIVVHIALSATWVKKTARNAKAGKLTARRTALAVVGSLLAATTVALGVSSVAISGILASAGFVWTLGSYSFWAAVHTFSAYALCALVVVHLAMHWAFLASAFKVPYNPSRRRAIATGVNAAAALGVVAVGVTLADKMKPQALGTTSDLAETESNTATDASSSALPSSEGSGKHHRRGSGNAASGTTSSGSARTFTDSGSESAAEPNSNSGNSGSTVSGICTLCRKQCPLSAPKCNKPYEAGLLS